MGREVRQIDLAGATRLPTRRRRRVRRATVTFRDADGSQDVDVDSQGAWVLPIGAGALSGSSVAFARTSGAPIVVALHAP